MSNKTKKKGLGFEVMFAEEPLAGAEREPLPPTNVAEPAIDPDMAKVRKTYWIYARTERSLNELKGAALIRGEKVSYSDLLDEAVRLLVERYDTDDKS